MIVFQSLRLFMPVPPFVSIFVIGSLVNACLLIAVEIAGWRLALIPAIVAPVVAYMQQVLPLPVFIIPIAAANGAYVTGYMALAERNRLLAVILATAAKFTIIYVAVHGLIKYVALPAKLAAMLTMLLGWPQIVTGFIGGMICLALRKRLQAVSRQA
jgi:hypothetical protein